MHRDRRTRTCACVRPALHACARACVLHSWSGPNIPEVLLVRLGLLTLDAA